MSSTTNYAILQNPGHNRVYFTAARSLAHIELKLAAQKMSAKPFNLREEAIGGLPYLLFDTESPLTEADILLLSRLSFVYGIFKLQDDLLCPLEKNPAYLFESDDITSILKYNGKTNELFTRMLINIALCCSRFNHTDNISLLDPLCGKGTSLFEALLCGYNVCGVDLDEKMIREAYNFLKKYLENARIKHSSHQERQGLDKKKKYTANRNQIKLSNASAEFIYGDTRDIDSFYRKNSFHIIVGDLPYGVQHASKTKSNESRNALPLLAEALPAWHKVLKSGGALALAWNLFLISRADMEDILIKNGFKIVEESFIHRVDQAIQRDVVIALKA